MAYRILLVEDDSSIREVISDFFSGKGGDTELVMASDGGEGLELIGNGEFDLIMLDVMLPNIDGFTLCREIRSERTGSGMGLAIAKQACTRQSLTMKLKAENNSFTATIKF